MNNPFRHHYTLKSLNRSPKDVSGAGDSLLISSSMAIVSGLSVFESVYIYSLLSYGIIPFIIMCIAMKKYMKTTIKENEDILRTIMLVFLIGGLMERFCIEVQYNIFLLYFSYIIYDNKNKKEKVLEE